MCESFHTEEGDDLMFADEHAYVQEAERMETSSTVNRFVDEWEVEDDSHVLKRHSMLTAASRPFSVLRNDQTPLNTPSTPQLVKLQLKNHQQHQNHSHHQSYSGSHRPNILLLYMERVVHGVHDMLVSVTFPLLRRLRAYVEVIVLRNAPTPLLQSSFFRLNRNLLLWYLTLQLCVPIVLLLSPMTIALFICTSPIWIPCLALVFFRGLVAVLTSVLSTASTVAVHAAPCPQSQQSSPPPHQQPHPQHQQSNLFFPKHLMPQR